MEDPFLSPDAQLERLLSDYQTHGTLIVAFDFDNTIFDFHKKGYTFPRVIELLKKCNTLGFILVVFTSSKDQEFIKEHLASIGVAYWGINKSPVDSCSTPEKPYFNILLDDRAGLLSAYATLKNVVERIENV